jgi:hypothetical protein
VRNHYLDQRLHHLPVVAVRPHHYDALALAVGTGSTSAPTHLFVFDGGYMVLRAVKRLEAVLDDHAPGGQVDAVCKGSRGA